MASYTPARAATTTRTCPGAPARPVRTVTRIFDNIPAFNLHDNAPVQRLVAPDCPPAPRKACAAVSRVSPDQACGARRSLDFPDVECPGAPKKQRQRRSMRDESPVRRLRLDEPVCPGAPLRPKRGASCLFQ